MKNVRNLLTICLLVFSSLTLAAEKKVEQKAERKPTANGSAEFIGCWDSTQLGVVSGESLFVISRGKDSVWLKTNNSKAVKAILNYAALAPVKGWNICLSGISGSDLIQVTEAFICTRDESAGACDVGSIVASSKMAK